MKILDKLDKKINEVYVAGKGGLESEELFNAAHGMLEDLQKMVGFGNKSGALQLLNVINTKLMKDLSNVIKKI